MNVVSSHNRLPVPVDPDDVELQDRRVFGTRVETLFEHSRAVLIANVVNAALVGAIVWDSVAQPVIVGWWACMLAMVAARVALGRAFQKDHSLASSNVWARRFTLGSLASGLIWGIGAAALFAPGDLPSQVLLAFVIGGMGAGASSTVASHLPAFYAYLIPSVIPLTVRFAAEGDELHWVMAGMLLLFALLFVRIGRTTHSTLVESYRLRFSNEALVERLCDAREELEQTNANLENRVVERTDSLAMETQARIDMEHRLHQSQKLEAVGRLTGGVAHDFNNHLTVILQCVEMLDDHNSPGEAAQLTQTAREAALRGAELTKNLLAFSRKQALHPQVLDASATVARLAHSMITRVMPEGIEVCVEPSEHPALVEADRAQLETALLNLVLNARDAMPEGGRLTLRTTESDAGVQVAVIDDGSGMAAEVLDHVFEPFFTTKGDTGTGLGLSMVHGFASQSGGDIRIESSPGVGTTVSLCLPKYEGDAVPAEAIEPDGAPRGSGERVLVVEDKSEVLASTVKLLEGLGYDVLSAPNVALALAELERGRADLVLSDIMMPGGRGGLDLAEEVERRWPDMQILLVTGHAPDVSRAARYPVLAKPYLRAQLARALRAQLD